MHGTATATTAMQKSDLLINLGARFDDRITGRLDSFARDAKIIHVDIDPAELGKVRRPDVPIVGDCRLVIEEMVRLDLLGPAGGSEEELDERTVRSRYIVGLLAPRGSDVAVRSWTFDGICREMVAGTTEGRQALVGSLWHAPLPTLAGLPAAALLPGGGAVPLVSRVTVLIALACLFRLLLHFCRRSLPPWTGFDCWLITLLLLASRAEAVLEPQAAVTLTVATLTLIKFADWYATRQLEDLVKFAFALALLALCGAPLAGLTLLLALLLPIVALLDPVRRPRFQGLLILGLLPALYAMGIWTLMSRLILSDALYACRFLIRGLTRIDAHLLIAGIGPMEAEWRALAGQAGVAAKITWLGEVSDEALPALYRSADLFVLPASNASEAFGLVQVEAMAAGLPVVSTELGTGTSYVNQHGVTGLVVPPRDSDALAEAINALLSDDARRAALAAAALERVAREFDVDVMVGRVLALYGDLIR